MTAFNSEEIAYEAIEKGEDPLEAVVFQALGAASVCWNNMIGAGVFESDRAKAIGEDLLAYIKHVQQQN